MRRPAIGLLTFLFVVVSATGVATLAEGQTAKPAPKAAPTKPAPKTAPQKPAKDAGAPEASAAAVEPGPVATSPTPTPSASAPAVPIPEKTAGMDGATYGVKLRDLESRVDDLKDQIRRSHTRLALLSDTILSGGASGSRAEVVFKNEMSSAFRLVRALFIVDGAVQYNRADDSGALADQKEIPIFNGSIPPGDHTVQAVLNFQGNGYGVFTYLKGYKFEVKSAHSFTAVEGKTLGLAATALEKGGVTTPLEQRPTIDWNEKVGSFGSSSAPIAAPAPGAKASGSVSIGGGKAP